MSVQFVGDYKYYVNIAGSKNCLPSRSRLTEYFAKQESKWYRMM